MLQSALYKIVKIEERTERIEKKQQERDARDSAKTFNIFGYFPASSVEIINDFISNKDGDFKEKKEAFECYLNCVTTMDPDMDSFSAALLKVLFTKAFIRDHRWPTSE